MSKKNARSQNTLAKKKCAVVKHWDLYLLLLPGMILTFIFRYLPIGGLVIAFQKFDIFSGYLNSPWVGLDNFRRAFSDPYIYKVFGNTLIISIYKLLFVFPLPIILAILINEMRHVVFKRTIQTLVYLPHFLSWSIVYGIFFAIMAMDGPVNDFLALLGLPRTAFFVSSGAFRSLLVGADAWKTVGWSAIVYLAALTAIDPALYEAAQMDGAGKWSQIWNITLPGLSSTIMLMLVLRLGTILNAGFEQILIFYNPTVYNVADVIDTYMYRTGLGQMEFSYAAAVGLFNSVICLILVLGSNYISKKKFDSSIW